MNISTLSHIYFGRGLDCIQIIPRCVAFYIKKHFSTRYATFLLFGRVQACFTLDPGTISGMQPQPVNGILDSRRGGFLQR